MFDPAGATVPNATVKIVSNSTHALRNTKASAAGTYVVTNLLTDEYTVTVEASGFSTFKQALTLTVGAKVGLDARLTVGASSTVVEVAEQTSQINGDADPVY